MFPAAAREKSVLIVAHPDDEALWFSSVVPHVDRIIICFRPGVASRHDANARIISDYPLDNVQFLSVTTFYSYHRLNFILPIKKPCGLLIKNSVRAVVKYWKNCRILTQKLNTLINEGSNVFTHNPWGEYGHEEHIQISSILAEMQKRKDITLWYSNYGSFKTYPKIKKIIFSARFESFTLPIDQNFTQTMKSFYVDRHSWTWKSDWQWFDQETYFSLKKGTSLPKYQHTIPLNLFNAP